MTATFTDGTNEDITPFCDFKISDDAIAHVSPFGLLTPRQPGDAGLTVLYRGSVKAIRVLVPAPARPGAYPKVPEANYIDEEVFAKHAVARFDASSRARISGRLGALPGTFAGEAMT